MAMKALWRRAVAVLALVAIGSGAAWAALEAGDRLLMEDAAMKALEVRSECDALLADPELELEVREHVQSVRDGSDRIHLQVAALLQER